MFRFLLRDRVFNFVETLKECPIVETGTHKDLKDKCGLYRRLWNLQQGL